MDKLWARDVKIGARASGVFSVGKKQQLVSGKTGKSYLKLTLQDRTGLLDARMWAHVEQVGPTFDVGDLVQVEGDVVEFRGEPQLTVDALAKLAAEAASALPAADFVPPAPPAEPKPARPADAKPADAKPADAKPAEPKPAEAKAHDAKAHDAKPSDARPADVKADAKAHEAKPADMEAKHEGRPAPRPREDGALQALREEISKTKDVYTCALLFSFLDDRELCARLRRAPASPGSSPGGLVEHILSCVRLAHRLCEHYPAAERDVVVAGVFLHGLGRLAELSPGASDEGRLVGHAALAAQWVHERARTIGGFPPELEHHIIHTVVAHPFTIHLGGERAAPRPMTFEALLVHHVVELDSRIHAWVQQISRGGGGERWAEPARPGEHPIFRGPAPTEGGRRASWRRARPAERPQPQPQQGAKPAKAKGPKPADKAPADKAPAAKTPAPPAEPKKPDLPPLKSFGALAERAPEAEPSPDGSAMDKPPAGSAMDKPPAGSA